MSEARDDTTTLSDAPAPAPTPRRWTRRAWMVASGSMVLILFTLMGVRFAR